MTKNIEKLRQQLEQLKEKMDKNVQEQKNLKENNPAVRRYIRLNFEERKLEGQIFELKDKIEDEIKLNCQHALVDIGDNNYCCIKCGLSTEFTNDQHYIKNRKIYEQTKDNCTIINTDYKCDKKVMETIKEVIYLQYPYISEDEFVHFFAVALHNMQTKKKSDNVKRGRAKRLYIKPALLEKSNLL